MQGPGRRVLGFCFRVKGLGLLSCITIILATLPVLGSRVWSNTCPGQTYRWGICMNLASVSPSKLLQFFLGVQSAWAVDFVRVVGRFLPSAGPFWGTGGSHFRKEVQGIVSVS